MAQTSDFKRFTIWKLSHWPNCIACCMVILALFSCSKEEIGRNNLSPAGSLTFTINGTTFNWDEERDTASSDYLDMAIYPDWSGHTLNAGTNLKPNRPYRLVNMPIPTSTLAVNAPYTYTNSGNTSNLAVAISTATTQYTDPSVDYRAYPGDQVTVTITRIQDNRANGTFSAELTRVSDGSKVSITAGKFENIRITQ